MQMLLYCSMYRGSPFERDRDIEMILDSASRNNKQHQLTGVLLYDEGAFIQLLEGQKSDVDALMSIIKQDTRHKKIRIIFYEEIRVREFEDWSMKYFDCGKANRLSAE